MSPREADLGGPMPDQLDRLQGALADRYTLQRELGRGGMAVVYLAHDLKHDRDVALKVLRPELTAILGRERFLAEIRLAAQLDHPHILTLLDSGESESFVWYILPFIRGESLRQKLTREKQLAVEEALPSQRRSPARWSTRTSTASSTVTSSRRTSCSTKARRCWRTSASRWPWKKRAASGSPRRA